MQENFIIVEVISREGGTPKPNGTRKVASGETLEDMREFLDQKTGSQTRKPIADGGRDDG